MLQARRAKLKARIKDIERERTPILFAHVGMITIEWARMENILEATNRAIFHFGGGETIEAEAPESLNRMR